MILNNIVKVLIVDDHVVVRLGIASILKENKDILIIGEVQNGTDALALIETKNPDKKFVFAHCSRILAQYLAQYLAL